jgi:ABC-type antimicrobial peptide transport system permease subunit
LTASRSASFFRKWSLRLSLPAIIVASVFSAVIGLIFGVYRAEGLDPVEALRAE